jgi:SAM-dependent methyltransferase
MFFEDKDAALAEMHRVLKPGGRATLSVFEEITRHPFYVALNQAVVRRLATPAVATIFALGDADALAESLSRAGFRNASIEPVSLTARMGPPEQFLTGEIELDTAAIPAMQALAPNERQKLIASIEEEMAGPLRAVTIDGEVVIDFHFLVARARA